VSRDYQREYVAAQRRAQERGFRSVAEQRRLPRLPKNLAAHRLLPDEARWTRSAASGAIEMSRAAGLPLEVATSHQGISVATARYWFPDAVRPTRHGRTRPTRSDRHMRLRPLAVDDEVRFIETHGNHAAAKAYEVFGVQWDVVHGRLPPEALDPYRGLRLGGGVVVTDADLLERLANAGQFRIDEAYRLLLA
jgi:hypothetical protein